MSSLAPLPAAQGLAAIYMASLASTLVGLEAPPGGARTLELKPYAISEVAGTRSGAQEIANDFTGDLGFDLKYGVTESLVADLTVNTDFAQVEADEQQVNLTRFSLFFPEKREFFLENQGIFVFGGARNAGTRGGGTDTPVLFYSREIGLDGRQEVPMDVGGRLTGRLGRFSIGVMNIQTGDVADIGAQSTNFTVARVNTVRTIRKQLVLHGFDETLARKTRVEPARTPGLRPADGSGTVRRRRRDPGTKTRVMPPHAAVFDRETEAELFAVATRRCPGRPTDGPCDPELSANALITLRDRSAAYRPALAGELRLQQRAQGIPVVVRPHDEIPSKPGRFGLTMHPEKSRAAGHRRGGLP